MSIPHQKEDKETKKLFHIKIEVKKKKVEPPRGGTCCEIYQHLLERSSNICLVSYN
jgi:hypothetical protein